VASRGKAIRYTIAMLRIIFWTVIVVVFLSFFGISIQSLFENDQTQSNFSFVFDLVEQGWDIIWGSVSGIIMPIVEFITEQLPS
jgi:hypothetical protein